MPNTFSVFLRCEENTSYICIFYRPFKPQ